MACQSVGSHTAIHRTYCNLIAIKLIQNCFRVFVERSRSNQNICFQICKQQPTILRKLASRSRKTWRQRRSNELTAASNATCMWICASPNHRRVLIIMFHLLLTGGLYHSHNETTHEHKKWLAITHCRIGVCTRPTLIGAKHFTSAPTVASCTHHNAWIQ